MNRSVLLKGFGYLWLIASLSFVSVGIVDLGIRKGIPAVQGFLSPFSVFNWIVIALTIAPGVIALLGSKTNRWNLRPGRA